MAPIQRWFGRDLLISRSDLVLTASSQAAGMPPSYLTDPMRRKPWRTETGWFFGPNNSHFEFTRSGLRTATLSGSYPTPATAALALRTAMIAADPGHPYNVEYDTSVANGFRVFYDSGAPLGFGLPIATGANAYRSCAADFGFDPTGGDRAATDDHVADDPAYQSRHFLVIVAQDGSSFDVEAFGVLEHTALIAGSAGVRSRIFLQGNAGAPAGAPSYSQELQDLHHNLVVGALNPCLEVLSPAQSFSWWRYVIDDVQNHKVPYFQAGGLPLLSLMQLTEAEVQRELVNSPKDHTRIYYAVDGEKHTRRRRFENSWKVQLKPITDTDRVLWYEFANQLAVGDDFYWQLNDADPTTVMYGSFPVRPVDTPRSHLVSALDFQFDETS
jgi:hypothetical protein